MNGRPAWHGEPGGNGGGTSGLLDSTLASLHHSTRWWMPTVVSTHTRQRSMHAATSLPRHADFWIAQAASRRAEHVQPSPSNLPTPSHPRAAQRVHCDLAARVLPPNG